MRTIAEDASDHAAAGCARPHLQKQADAVAICRLDYLRIVDAVQRLAEDRRGGTFAGDLVGITLDAAVIDNAGRCFRGVQMQIVVRGCHLLRHFAMHRGHSLQREKPAAERCHQPG